MERLNAPKESVEWDLNALGRLQLDTAWFTPAGDWTDIRGCLMILYAIARNVSWRDPHWKAPTVPPFCVEIGTREGVSTLAILTAMRDAGGKLMSIDCDEHACQVSAEVVERAGLSEWHAMVQGRSEEVAPAITQPVDFLFIDGDHSEEGVRRDVEHYADKVRVGGFAAFHDYYSDPGCMYPPVSPPYPSGVSIVVEEMRASGNWEVLVMPWSYGLAVCRRLR